MVVQFSTYVCQLFGYLEKTEAFSYYASIRRLPKKLLECAYADLNTPFVSATFSSVWHVYWKATRPPDGVCSMAGAF